MVAEAVRIQYRGRFAGWRKPDDVVYVGRGAGRWGRWGNPFRVGQTYPLFWIAGGDDQDTTIAIGDAAAAVDAYERMLRRSPAFVADIRAELAGCRLACWCPPGSPCHGDVLLRVARGEEP